MQYSGGQSFLSRLLCSLDGLVALQKQTDHLLRPRLAVKFINAGEFPNMMSVTQRMQAAVLHVGLPVVVDRVALQPRKDPDGIGGCLSAALMGKVIGKGLVARPMEPVQLSVDAQSCLIEMHHRRPNELLSNLFHHLFQTSSTARICAGEGPGAHRNGEQV